MKKTHHTMTRGNTNSRSIAYSDQKRNVTFMPKGNAKAAKM